MSIVLASNDEFVARTELGDLAAGKRRRRAGRRRGIIGQRRSIDDADDSPWRTLVLSFDPIRRAGGYIFVTELSDRCQLLMCSVAIGRRHGNVHTGCRTPYSNR